MQISSSPDCRLPTTVARVFGSRWPCNHNKTVDFLINLGLTPFSCGTTSYRIPSSRLLLIILFSHARPPKTLFNYSNTILVLRPTVYLRAPISIRRYLYMKCTLWPFVSKLRRSIDFIFRVLRTEYLNTSTLGHIGLYHSGWHSS